MKATSGWEIYRNLRFYKRITNILKGIPSVEKYNGNNKSGFNALATGNENGCEGFLCSWWVSDLYEGSFIIGADICCGISISTNLLDDYDLLGLITQRSFVRLIKDIEIHE